MDFLKGACTMLKDVAGHDPMFVKKKQILSEISNVIRSMNI